MGMSETSRNFLFQPSLGAAGEAEALPHSMKNCLEFSWGTQHKQGDNKSKARRVFCWFFLLFFFFQAAASAPGLAPGSRAIPRQGSSSCLEEKQGLSTALGLCSVNVVDVY